MRSVHLRRLLATGAVLALLLAACSSPQTPTPAQPDNPVVELDGYRAQIDMTKVDLQPLSFWNPPRTTYCENNVAYAQVIVPMLGFDDGHLTSYVDVFWMPRDWNHKLALYAHGYVSPSDPGFLDQILNPGPSSAPLLETRDRLLCEGYALGASSFASQGFAVQQGIVDTHLMNAVFPFIFWRRPSETYVFGSSMGGLITVALAELFPNRYDGAMPTCGPIAGSLAEFSYIGNVRLLFDTAYPPLSVDPVNGVLQGSLTNWVQDDTDPSTPGYWATRVGAAITLAPGGFQALVNTKVNYTDALGLPLLQTPATYGDPGDVLSAFPFEVAGNALLHALRYHVEGAGDAMDRGDGSPFGNVGVTYEALGLPGLTTFVNPYTTPPYGQDPFVPYVPDNSAVAYYSLFYQPSGTLRVPTLSLHNAYDPDVPYVHEEIYRGLAAANGQPGMLHLYKVEGPIPPDLLAQLPSGTNPALLTGYGHCNILPTDLVASLDALAADDYGGLDANPRFDKVQ